jgi:hypothetical protein
MTLVTFEITSIGPMFREMDPPFARCKVSIGVWDEGGREGAAVDSIDLDLVITHEDSDSLGALKSRALLSAARVLQEAAALLKARDVKSLQELATLGEGRRSKKEAASVFASKANDDGAKTV